MYIARDKDNTLWLYANKPIRGERWFNSLSISTIPPSSEFEQRINPDLYPEVTWENSPKELIIKS